MAEAVVNKDALDIHSPARDEYSTLDSRLVTFCDWPPSLTQKPIDLAEASFYYTGLGDEVKCFSCDISLSFWQKDEIPWQRHAISFPSCDLVIAVMGIDYINEALSEKAIKQIQGNLPTRKSIMHIDEELEKIIKSDTVRKILMIGMKEESIRQIIRAKLQHGENPFHSPEILVDEILSKEFRKLECNIRVSSGQILPPPREPLEPGCDKLDIGKELCPFRPDLCNYKSRLNTFMSWPPSIPKNVEELAEAGFYYTGRGDKVRCFCCDVSMSCWYEDSDPWLKHAITRPNCDLVLITKGQEFVNEALILKAAVDLGLDDSSIKEVFQRREGLGPFLSLESLCSEILEYQSTHQNKILCADEVTSAASEEMWWECEVCTLTNNPKRIGCAACSTDRPNYDVTEEYKMNETGTENRHNETNKRSIKASEEEKVKNYQQLVDLQNKELIIPQEEFECTVCLVECQPMEGIVLKECLHVFCRDCLVNTIRFNEKAEVICPYRDNNYTCDSTLLEREIKALVTPEEYEQHLAKSIALAETKISNAFHCKTPDCKGWCIYEDDVNMFVCPICMHTNCLTCQAIHEDLNCKEFQEQLTHNSDSKKTKEMLKELVEKREAMNCPSCQIVIMKKSGCDWLVCTMCKTEICWVTRGPRWGPNGRGDTTGGCKCGVNSVKCHPGCGNCH